MSRSAPRSIDQYLKQLRDALAGADAALIQDALYDAEEYLRAEVAAHPGKSEADVLELIASTYGAPDEVAAAYRESDARVSAAITLPQRRSGGRFWSVYLDPRAYTSLLFMVFALLTGMAYFAFAMLGMSLSAGLAVLIIGIPFFLAFMAVGRVLSLAEGRLIEAMTGERMPRRPLYAAAGAGFMVRIGAMLKDARTWSTLAYFVLMLPLGVIYFVIAVTGLTLSLSLIGAPLLATAGHWGWLGGDLGDVHIAPDWLAGLWAAPLLVAIGVLLLTVLLHLARLIGRLHARFAKTLLVARAAPAEREVEPRSLPSHQY